jgi:hypothetical protein
MEETEADHSARRGRRWRAVFILLYFTAMVLCLIAPFENPDLKKFVRIAGVLMVPLGGFIISRLFLNAALFDAPYLWRKLVYRGWHGKYRAFEDKRVRVIDGERERPSRVFAADIFQILELPPVLVEPAKLAARYRGEFTQGTDGEEDGEWLFTDAACMAFVRGYLDDQRSARGRTAHQLALWLERMVFMPIDNRRTKATGKTYAFTKEASRR